MWWHELDEVENDCISHNFSLFAIFLFKNDQNWWKFDKVLTKTNLHSFFETRCIARLKARSRLPIRHNWTFFAMSYGWDVTSGNLSNSAFLEGAGYFERQFQTEGVVVHQPPLCQNPEWLPFCVVSKYPHCIVWFCYKARVWRTDGQTDGQNYDSQDRANIAASRGKNALIFQAALPFTQLWHQKFSFAGYSPRDWVRNSPFGVQGWRAGRGLGKVPQKLKQFGDIVYRFWLHKL